MIRVDFPNKLFLTIEHNVSQSGRFEFEFQYSDQRDEDENDSAGDGYSLIHLKPVVKEHKPADMTLIYIFGGVAALTVIIILICVARKVRKQKKLTEEVKTQRDNGIMQKWGINIE